MPLKFSDDVRCKIEEIPTSLSVDNALRRETDPRYGEEEAVRHPETPPADRLVLETDDQICARSLIDVNC